MIKQRIGLSVLAILLVLSGSFGVYQYTQATDYRHHMENQYHRSFYELLDAVSTISTDLKKGKVVTDSQQMVLLAGDIRRRAEFAQSNLGQLPIVDIELENTSRFLAQVGDYMEHLSHNILSGQPITKEQKQQILQLEEYANTLSVSLNNMYAELISGELRLDVGEGESGVLATSNSFVPDLESVEEEFADYPTLLYDGPFSDHHSRATSVFLEGQEEISPAEAQRKVEQFLDGVAITKITHTGDGEGVIRTYSFFVETVEKGISFQIDVSRIGGYVVWMLCDYQPPTSTLVEEDAIARAEMFLNSRGYANMKENYYERNGHLLTVHFAYVQDDVVMYPDLIKVTVSLLDGRLLGFESYGYLMHHQTDRSLSDVQITPEQAREICSNVIQVETQQLCVIPMDSGAELLCYECKGRVGTDQYLIYLNAKSGKQEKILLLLLSENGTLTV